jgi:hypothetical protein
VVDLWLRLCLVEDGGSRARQALDALKTLGTPKPREEMRLHTAVGASLRDAPEMEAAFTRALDIAQTLDDSEYQLRALRGLSFYNAWANHPRGALSFAQRFHELATSGTNQSDRLFGERMLGSSKHFWATMSVHGAIANKCSPIRAAADLGQPAVRFQDVIRFQT